MSEERRVQFGHSEFERLVLSNFEMDPDFYSLDAELRAGSFRGAARVFGHVWELQNLHKSLQHMSTSFSGEAEFENLEGQLKLHCYIDVRGAIQLKIRLADHSNRVECEFDTDLTSLDSTIAALAIVI